MVLHLAGKAVRLPSWLRSESTYNVSWRSLCSATSDSNHVSIAVIGSGPAGFYFTDRICKLLGDHVSVDIIDALPTPFGLVRSGVAPDHPDTKNVIKKFQSIASDPRVRFYGNVTLGKDVTLNEVRSLYSCVMLSYGAANDRKLRIPGEDNPWILSARQFVNWYNGHPAYSSLPIDLASTSNVGIVGLGNVALDCARILLKPADFLNHTDIAEHALAQLKHSSVRNVHIIGRRGPFQAQFSGKELREVLTLGNISVTMHPSSYEPTEFDLREPRKNQKGFAEFSKAHGKRPISEPHRSLHLHFLTTPLEARGSSGTPNTLVVEHNRLEERDGAQYAIGTGQTDELPTDLLLKSVGYFGEPVEGVPFDQKRGVVPNDAGRVVDLPEGGAAVPGLYVSGWLKRGPQGIIGTNIIDAQQTAACVAEDAAILPRRRRSDALAQLLQDRRVPTVTWQHWLRIDEAERSRGTAAGRPRVKFVHIADMLDAAGVK